jgi:hypothetical protein
MKTFLVYSNDGTEPIILDEQSFEVFFSIENIDFYTVIEVL